MLNGFFARACASQGFVTWLRARLLFVCSRGALHSFAGDVHSQLLLLLRSSTVGSVVTLVEWAQLLRCLSEHIYRTLMRFKLLPSKTSNSNLIWFEEMFLNLSSSVQKGFNVPHLGRKTATQIHHSTTVHKVSFKSPFNQAYETVRSSFKFRTQRRLLRLQTSSFYSAKITNLLLSRHFKTPWEKSEAKTNRKDKREGWRRLNAGFHVFVACCGVQEHLRQNPAPSLPTG